MKKILCVFLALLMAFGGLSLTAFALEESGEVSGEVSAEPTVSDVESSDDPAESVEPPIETSELPDESSTLPDDSSGEESTQPGESSDPVETCSITFFLKLGAAGVGDNGFVSIGYGGSVYSNLSPDTSYVVQVPLGEDAVFTVTAAEGFRVSNVSVGTIDTYTVAPETFNITISSVSRNADVRIDLEAADAIPFNVTWGEGGSVQYENKNYFLGNTVSLNIVPNSGYGIKSVTVNGVALESIPYVEGAVDVTIQGETTVAVEFSQLCEVVVQNDLGGSFTVSGFAEGETQLRVPMGRSIYISVTADEGKHVEKIELLESGVTINNQTFHTLEVVQNEIIRISYADGTPAEDTFRITTEVVGGEGGEVFANPTTVSKNGRVDVNFVPADGFKIDYVTVNNDEWTVMGESIIIRNVTENKHIRVKFVAVEDPESSESESSAEDSVTESESEPETSEDVNTGSYSAEELKAMLSSDAAGVAYIELSGATVIEKSGLEYLNTVLATQTLRIGVQNKYWWVVPSSSSFSLAADIDFGVIFDGAYTDRVKEYFKTRAEANGFSNLPPILLVERNDASALPQGTRIAVNAVALTAKDETPFAVGNKAEWLKYTPLSSEGALSFADDKLSVVSDDGWLEALMPSENKYGVFLGYIGSSSWVSINYNDSQCSFDAFGIVTQGENGMSVSKISQKSGTLFRITVYSRAGYCIQNITSDYANMVILDENGKDITNDNYAGIHGDVVIQIEGISADGSITISMAETATQTPATKPDSGVSIEIIIVIVIIAIVMIGGGVFFVIKWRQSDDDDEYEDFEDDEEE